MRCLLPKIPVCPHTANVSVQQGEGSGPRQRPVSAGLAGAARVRDGAGRCVASRLALDRAAGSPTQGTQRYGSDGLRLRAAGSGRRGTFVGLPVLAPPQLLFAPPMTITAECGENGGHRVHTGRVVVVEAQAPSRRTAGGPSAVRSTPAVDAFFVDLPMPGMSGHGLVEEAIRGRAAHAGVPIMLVTGAAYRAAGCPPAGPRGRRGQGVRPISQPWPAHCGG